jgi:hypothetical protein
MSSPKSEFQVAYEAAKTSLPAIDPTEVLDDTARTREVPEAVRAHLRDLAGAFLELFPTKPQQRRRNLRSSFWLDYVEQTQCSPWYRYCKTNAGPKYLLSEDKTYKQFTSTLDTRLRRKEDAAPPAVAAPAEAEAADEAPAAAASYVNVDRFGRLKKRVGTMESTNLVTAQGIQAMQTAQIEAQQRIKLLEKRLGALEQKFAAQTGKRPATQLRQAAKPAPRQATTPKVLVDTG